MRKSGCHNSHCLAIVVRTLLNLDGSQTACGDGIRIFWIFREIFGQIKKYLAKKASPPSDHFVHPAHVNVSAEQDGLLELVDGEVHQVHVEQDGHRQRLEEWGRGEEGEVREATVAEKRFKIISEIHSNQIRTNLYGNGKHMLRSNTYGRRRVRYSNRNWPIVSPFRPI